MLILSVNIGFYNPVIVTMAISAVDSSQSSLAGASIYMFRLVGGALGLATILVLALDTATGICRAFIVEAHLSLVGFIVTILFFYCGHTQNSRAKV